MKRPVAGLGVYTAGYEGQSIDGFLNMLVQQGIRLVIDVRNNPVARRYGFHKATLSRLAGYLDLEYVHVPELGVQSQYRKGLASLSDYEALFEQYKAHIAKHEEEAVHRIAQLMNEKPSVLVCMERDPNYCHRSRLAEVVADRTHLPVQHFGTSE
jgi:uncharacterized protein (DUF488 family)